MQFTTLLTTAALAVTSVVALPAAEPAYGTAPKPAPVKTPSYRLQVRSAGANPAVDKIVQNLYVTISTGPNAPNAVLSKDKKQTTTFTFTPGEKSIIWSNKKSLVLGSTTSPLGTNQHWGITKYENGANHNAAIPYSIRGGHCFNGPNNGKWAGWLACTSQYGPYLGWVDHDFDLAAHNAGSVFPCTVVALCQEPVA